MSQKLAEVILPGENTTSPFFREDVKTFCSIMKLAADQCKQIGGYRS